MGKPLRVLILEDSENDARLMAHQLQEGGYEPVWERVDSLDGLERALNRASWDLIVSDHSMPQFSAIIALDVLKARGLDIPLIIVSGTIEEERAVAAMRAGACDYIMKGNTARLLPAIERELREAESRRKARLVEAQLRQAQKLEAVGRLAGGVAHDFNNILTAILGYSDLLLPTFDAADPRREDVAEIRKTAERAAALTRQLLAFSRRQVLAPRPVDLNALVSEMTRMLGRLIGEDVKILLKLDARRGVVQADPNQLEQVVANLAVNSRDAMPAGGTLTISTSDESDAVLLAVADTGSGMDQETLARMYEPFFTTKPQDKGTGLGLSTVHGIVAQSGGSIDVDSAVGAGTTFRIRLPRAKEASGSAPSAAPAGARAASGETILVAEDERPLRALICRVLRARGYRVLDAGNGEDARGLAATVKEPIHLLIADMVMPKMSGKDLAEEIRGLHPETRVLLMSGYYDLALAPSAAAAYLPKPFPPEALAHRVREILDS